jgi:hypothetical protein
MYLTENRCRRFGKDLKSENVQSLECNYSEKTGLIRGPFAKAHKFVVWNLNKLGSMELLPLRS